MSIKKMGRVFYDTALHIGRIELDLSDLLRRKLNEVKFNYNSLTQHKYFSLKIRQIVCGDLKTLYIEYFVVWGTRRKKTKKKNLACAQFFPYFGFCENKDR